MILKISYADYNKELNKWLLIYDVITINGVKYSQKVNFVNKESMLSYKKNLQDYIYLMNAKEI